MRSYTIKKIEHVVYDSLDEVPKDLRYLDDWRKGEVGDWILTDDDCVLQVLRVGYLSRPTAKERTMKYVGTCTGTFIAQSDYKMDADRRDQIYTFSGRTPMDYVENRERITACETAFAQFIAAGMNRKDAYMSAFETKNPKHATHMAGILMKQERVRTVVREELKPVLSKLGINAEFVLDGIRSIAEAGERDGDKLKALFELADILEIKEKKKEITAIGGAVFKGFLPEDAEVVGDRKQLLGDGEDA